MRRYQCALLSSATAKGKNAGLQVVALIPEDFSRSGIWKTSKNKKWLQHLYMLEVSPDGAKVTMCLAASAEGTEVPSMAPGTHKSGFGAGAAGGSLMSSHGPAPSML